MYVVLSIYLPCDNFCNILNPLYAAEITVMEPRAYLRGGSNPPPPKFSDFFLKSEGKEIKRKRKKKECGGGGLPLNIFLGLIFF